MTVMILAAALAGLAGGLKAMIFQFVSLEDIALGLSGKVILITLLGGLGFFFGPVFGAAIVILMESYSLAPISLLRSSPDSFSSCAF